VRNGRPHRPVVAIALAMLIFVFAPLGRSVSTGGQQPTFRSETELVNLGATVVDKRGNFISNLTQEDFEIVEDGRKQSIRPVRARRGHRHGAGASRGVAPRYQRQHG
jgi:hypothetical protein